MILLLWRKSSTDDTNVCLKKTKVCLNLSLLMAVGQLSSALKSLEKLGLRGKIAIIGIAKRLEELFYPEDPIPLYLDKNRKP